jgi:hypothetical protein
LGGSLSVYFLRSFERLDHVVDNVRPVDWRFNRGTSSRNLGHWLHNISVITTAVRVFSKVVDFDAERRLTKAITRRCMDLWG